MALTLTVALPSFGRKELLFRTLTGLLSQTAPGDEVVLVDQNPGGLDLPALPHRERLRHLRLSPPSLTRARNLALQEARNRRVLFLDDDIEFGADLLKGWKAQAARIAETHPLVAVIAGAVDQEGWPTLEGVGFFDAATGEVRTRFDFRAEGALPFFPGGHFLLDRERVPAQTRFSPFFRGAAEGEEIEFALNLRAAGREIFGVPALRIFHLKAPGGCRSEAFQRRFARDQVHNRALLFARHGRLLSLGRFLTRMKGTLEYHSRYPRPPFRHHPGRLARLALGLAVGFARGLAARFSSGIRARRRARAPAPGHRSAGSAAGPARRFRLRK